MKNLMMYQSKLGVFDGKQLAVSNMHTHYFFQKTIAPQPSAVVVLVDARARVGHFST